MVIRKERWEYVEKDVRGELAGRADDPDVEKDLDICVQYSSRRSGTGSQPDNHAAHDYYYYLIDTSRN